MSGNKLSDELNVDRRYCSASVAKHNFHADTLHRSEKERKCQSLKIIASCSQQRKKGHVTAFPSAISLDSNQTAWP
jgi:hypothetical protein